MSDNESTLWWGKPLKAQRYHVFEGEGMSTSLCDNWMFGYNEIDPKLNLEDDSFREGKDCKECSRKAGLLEE